MGRSKRNHGFTLIEMMIVAAIASILLLAVIAMTSSSNDAYNVVHQDTEANFSLRRALNRLSDDMRQSKADLITLTPGFDWDQVEFQVPVSQAAGTVNWGAEGETGWKIRILVEDGWLIRRVVDGTGTVQRIDEVLARNVDLRFDNEKGFSVVQTGDLYNITLRVTAQRNERVWRRTETTSITTRN